ncbi:MAG: type I secretion system permease/ATPase [Alphaproteobacteria bacterium]|nr:type I secretion system permease/ATPase [Alphaproteobacteria bacterium]
MNTMNAQQHSVLENAFKTSKATLWFILLFSAAINILIMGMPLYSMKVLDTVISSGSLDTLVMLTIIIAVCFVVMSILMTVRGFILIKASEWLDGKLAKLVLDKSLTFASMRGGVGTSQGIRDLATIKAFVTGPTLISLVDAPWSLVFLLVILIINPICGLVAIVGSGLLLFLAYLNETATKEILNKANEYSIQNMAQTDLLLRNAEVIEAMGMRHTITSIWDEANMYVQNLQSQASSRGNTIMSITKFTRSFLQILLTGIGAFLVLKGQMTAGSIVATSILAGRALAPFEGAIGSWKGIASLRSAFHRLDKQLKTIPSRNETISLPSPKGDIDVEKCVYAPPGSTAAILKGISFHVVAGEIVGVIGPSAAGKTTLSKLLVGINRPSAGVVRLDGADVYTWNRQEFGKNVGYLPQDVELFQGSIKENIARMDPYASPEAIVNAAMIAGVHDMILRLPNGYDTEIGVGGTSLSAGQRQRVGLARAFFGNPRLLVLDEPNSNLDEAGESALASALKYAATQKITTFIISHRPSTLAHVDRILVLKEGIVSAFGPREEVMGQFTNRQLDQKQKTSTT